MEYSVSTLKTNTIQAATGSTINIATGTNLSGAAGSIVSPGQVIQTISTGTVATTSISASSWVDTNYTLSITPQFSNSKILFQFTNHVRVNGDGDKIRGGIRVKRTVSSSDTIVWNTDGSTEAIQVRNATNEHDTLAAVTLLDSPATTSSVTYTVQGYKQTGNYFFFRESALGGAIILQEIAQ